MKKEKFEGGIFEDLIFLDCSFLPLFLLMLQHWVGWKHTDEINGDLFASPVNMCFSFLFRISSECPACDYGCSSPTIHPGGQTSGLHASIHSDFPAALVPRNPRRSASPHCHHGPSGDLLCKLCKWIHPHKPGHSRRSSWSCRSSVGLSCWPPR